MSKIYKTDQNSQEKNTTKLIKIVNSMKYNRLLRVSLFDKITESTKGDYKKGGET